MGRWKSAVMLFPAVTCIFFNTGFIDKTSENHVGVWNEKSLSPEMLLQLKQTIKNQTFILFSWYLQVYWINLITLTLTKKLESYQKMTTLVCALYPFALFSFYCSYYIFCCYIFDILAKYFYTKSLYQTEPLSHDVIVFPSNRNL